MKLYYCQACGKVALDKYGTRSLSRGWDASCMINAIEVDSEKHWEKLREGIDWGTLGLPARPPMRYVCISKMSSSHINAILESKVLNISYEMRWIFEREKRYRQEHPEKAMLNEL